MRYGINPVNSCKEFKPFQVTLTFETKDEADFFYDKIMNKITKARFHSFHEAIYRSLNGKCHKDSVISGTI